MYKVKNLDKSTQRFYSNGKVIDLEPGKSIIVEEAPPRTPSFHIEVYEEKEEKKNKKEVK